MHYFCCSLVLFCDGRIQIVLRLILCAGVGDMRSMAVAFCYEDERLWLDQIACQWRGFFLCGTDSADAYLQDFLKTNKNIDAFIYGAL